MLFFNRSMKSEINQMQRRLQLLKDRNKPFFKNSKFSENEKSKKMLFLDKINANCPGSSLYFNEDEVTAVENCYRKSIELLNDHCRKKQRKKLPNNMSTNSKFNYNLSKKNIKIFNKNKKMNSAEIITFFEEDIYSNSLEALPQETTLVFAKRTIAKLDPGQSLENNDFLEKLEDSDVVYLQTINSEKTFKDVELKKVPDYETELINNKIHTRSTTSEELFAKNCKYVNCENYKPQRKPQFDKVFNSQHVERNYNKNNNNQDVIFLETICKPLESSETSEHNMYGSDVKNISDGFSISKSNETIEVLSSKSNLSDNKVPENSYFEGEISKNFYQRQINVENEYSEIIAPIWDFTEEPVDFDVPELHKNEVLHQWSKREIEILRSKGIAFKIGKWSEEEEALIYRNYKNFTLEFGVNDVCLLLGINRSKYEFKNVIKFWKAKHFLVRLGKDLNSRPLRNIYMKARNSFFPPNKRKKYSSKDIPFLIELHKKYGNNWFMIAQKFRLTPGRCRYLFFKYIKKTLEGKWTREERENLITAIRKISKVKDIFHKTLRRLPWERVAELVPTRTSIQCCNEWINNKAAVRKIWQDKYLVT